VRKDDPLGVLPNLGIQVHWAKPASGQSKPIERGLRDFAKDIALDPRFDGAYTGNRPDAKPENYGNRAIPLDDFVKVVAEGVEEHNSRQGRLSPTARGRSFDETFAESYAIAPIRKATEDQRRLWLMGQETGKLNKDNGQLQLFRNFYHSDWMSERAGKKIVARFDPEDLHSGVHIYELDGSYLGFAECRQKVGFFNATGAKEVERRTHRIKRAQKELLKAHRPLSVQDIAADRTARAATQSELVEAKVVKPVFSKRTVSVPRHQITSDPAVLEARQAFEQRLKDKKNSDPKPKPVGRFQPASTPRERFQDAKDIIAKSEAGKRVGSGEADWLRSYIELPEYRGFQKVEQFAKRDDAG
jgi:putative transposase